MNRCCQPFLGSGAILLALLSQQAAGNVTIRGDIIAADANGNLISCWKNIKDNVDQVIIKLQELKTDRERFAVKERYQHFDEVRDTYNQLGRRAKEGPLGAAMFIT
jgi:site-specific DNA-adenine methylase